jgi:hypothetical protein
MPLVTFCLPGKEIFIKSEDHFSPWKLVLGPKILYIKGSSREHIEKVSSHPSVQGFVNNAVLAGTILSSSLL